MKVLQRKIFIVLAGFLAVASSVYAQSNQGSSSGQSKRKPADIPDIITTAWEATEPMGLREWVPVDTLEDNYYLRSVASAVSDAYATTGNLGGAGKNMLFMQQRPLTQFFLNESMLQWFPLLSNHIYYNSAQPFTQVSYNTGGTRDNSQDRLTTIFSGNINRVTQIGANMDYLYSKGSYNNQSGKHFNWGFNGSYIGDHYEFQGAWYHYNALNKDNGGITDDLYITDPAKLQGGVTSINPKSIPTNLSKAHTRVKGGELFLNNTYKLGFWHETHDSINADSVIAREYVPVTSVTWTLNYTDAKHRFDDTGSEVGTFWPDNYFSNSNTDDYTTYWSLKNTLGISLLEGFNKYAKFGLSAFLTYEMRKFTLAVPADEPSGPTPLPDYFSTMEREKKQNLAWVGAQISKQHGSILTYGAIGEIGLIGDAIGEVRARGHIATNIPMFGDTVSVKGYGALSNLTAPYLINNFISNNFIWKNNFGKERRLRLGGTLDIPWTDTSIDIGTETLQNFIYFNDQGLPAQYSDAIQVFSAHLSQKLNVGILHFDNSITYQTSSNTDILPLPALALFSNLYIKCKIATLSLQAGIDCNYYTRYYAPAFQPATNTFHNQHKAKLGNYPFMNAYANMKLGRTRFYVMMTHVNQGLIGDNNYFSSPHYPLNPRRLLFGLSVEFFN